jgi:uncharacterized protein YoxC
MFGKQEIIEELCDDTGTLLSNTNSLLNDVQEIWQHVETINNRLDNLERDYKQLWNDRVDHEIFRSNVLKILDKN